MKRFLGRALSSPTLAAVLFVVGVSLVTQSDHGRATLWKWSQTAASNGSSDASINWTEGMSPSAVNDSARAMMAATAKYRDDISGALTTSGTSTAYTVTTNQGLTALTAGFEVCFAPHATNGATVTLVVDGLAAKPLRTAPGSSAELTAGVLVQGTPYCATYFASNSGEYILRAFYGTPYSIPLGGMIDYTGTTAPNSSFVLPYGQAISRTTYADYFSLVGTTYGSGNGSTTFNVPDLRGRVVAGDDNMGGSAAGRLTASYFGTDATVLGASGGAESHTLTISEMPSHNHGGATASGGVDHTHEYEKPHSGELAAASTNHEAGTTPANTGGASAYLHTHGISSEGGGGAHNNVQPTIVLTKILRIQ